MDKVINTTTKAAFAFALGFVFIGCLGWARAADKTRLSGYWNYNAAQSDDSQRKVEEAQIDSQSSVTDARGGSADPTAGTAGPGGGDGGPTGGGYPNIGGMGGRGGMGGMGGMGRGARQGTRGNEISSEQWDRITANPKYLHIDQDSGKFVVSNDSDESETFYPDSKKHDDKDFAGKKISTKARWDKDDFVAETKLNHVQKMTESYRLSDDGKQLTVTSEFEDPSLSHPVAIRRVYNAGKAPVN